MNQPTGLPLFFSLDTYYALIKMYISADEVERALWLINNPPAFYRKHPPPELIALKESLHRALWTPAQYRGIYDGVKDNSHWPHRACALEDAIKGRGPVHIMELAGGSMWLKDGLTERQYDFTYEHISLDGSAFVDASPGAHKVFVAFEIIEHLSNEWEIYQNYLKFGKTADTILISTPLYAFGGGMGLEFADRPLGHLRAYTEDELHKVCSDMFRGYSWHCYLSETITLVGKRNGQS